MRGGSAMRSLTKKSVSVFPSEISWEGTRLSLSTSAFPEGSVKFVTDDQDSARLILRVVSQYVRRGETIEAFIDATNVAETVVKMEPSDRVVISQPHTIVLAMRTV